MAKKIQYRIAKLDGLKGLFHFEMAEGTPIKIAGSKYRWAINDDKRKITNLETGFGLSINGKKEFLQRLEKMGVEKLDALVSPYLEFFGLIDDCPEGGKQYQTIFTKYGEQFQLMFKVPMTWFWDYGNTFNIVRFEKELFPYLDKEQQMLEDQGKEGISLKDAIIRRYGEGVGKFFDEILNPERGTFLGLLKEA